MKTDLQLARQEITALRGERDKLKDALRRQLGQQLDQAAAGDLVARVDELTRQNQQLTTFCGSCELRVLGGTPDHRETALALSERGRRNVIYPCVSRASSPILSVDL